MNSNDLELINQCLAGRTEAFGKLVLRHQDRLFRTLVSLLGSDEDARDVAQEAFVLAFQKLGTFRGDSAFYSWLFRIAFNASMSHKRKRRHATTSMDAAREQAGIEPLDDRSAGRPPSHSLEVREQQNLVQQALAELTDDYRTVLVLKELEGRKYQEIAEIIGCPIGTVRSRIHRAREEMREKLKGVVRD